MITIETATKTQINEYLRRLRDTAIKKNDNPDIWLEAYDLLFQVNGPFCRQTFYPIIKRRFPDFEWQEKWDADYRSVVESFVSAFNEYTRKQSNLPTFEEWVQTDNQ